MRKVPKFEKWNANGVAWEINYPDCWPAHRERISIPQNLIFEQNDPGFHGKCRRAGEISRENSYVRFHAATRRPAWDAKRQIKKHIAATECMLRMHFGVDGSPATLKPFTISVQLSRERLDKHCPSGKKKKHRGWLENSPEGGEKWKRTECEGREEEGEGDLKEGSAQRIAKG